MRDADQKATVNAIGERLEANTPEVKLSIMHNKSCLNELKDVNEMIMSNCAVFFFFFLPPAWFYHLHPLAMLSVALPIKF